MALATAQTLPHNGTRATARPADGLLAPERRALTIGLVLVVTVCAFEALAIATVMPAVQRDLGGIRLYGWAFSGFLLASLVGITGAGEACDRNGPARPFVAAVLLFGAGLLIGGLAPSMSILVLGRVVQGIGAGAVVSVAYVVIGRGYDERLRPRMFAVLSSAWVVPGLIGPAISGAVAEYASWRLIFLAILPFLAIAAVLAFPALERLGAPAAAPLRDGRIWRAVRLAVAAGLVLAGATSSSLMIGIPFVLCGIALAAPAVRGLLPSGTLRAAHGLPAAVASMGMLNLAFFGTEAFVPLMLTSLRGQSVLIAGVALTAATLSWTAGAWVQERIDSRVERRSIVMAGLLLVALGVGGATLVLLPAVPPLFIAPAWAVAGGGIGLAYPSIALIVLGAAAAGAEGAATASLKLSEVLGSAVGAGIGGAAIAAGAAGGFQTASIAVTFAMMGAVALAGVAVATRLRVPMAAQA